MAALNAVNHWIIRVNDGENFRNSVNPFWGVKRGQGGNIKTIVGKMKEGDVLWFCTSKPFGGKLIGMAEFVGFYDSRDEPLIPVNTLSNEEQGWSGNSEWDIQIHYKNEYDTDRQDIKACIQCSAIIMKYDTFREKVNGDLYEHYKNFKYYAVPRR